MRIGIAGVGLITIQSHLPAVLSMPDAELVALIDPSTDRARAVAADYGLKVKVGARLEEVARDLDALVIATPNHTHEPLAVAALQAGLHVLVEKPLATTVAQGAAIVAAAKQAERVAAVGYTTRFRDNYLTLKRLLAVGYYGAVKRYGYQFGTPGGWSALSAYSLSREATGGGVLVVTGTHFLDRALDLFGYPGECDYRDDGEAGPEANVWMRARHTYRGAPVEGVTRLSKTVRLPGGMVIETDQGRIILPESDSGPLLWRPASGGGVEYIVRDREAPQYPAEMESFQRQLRNFIDACHGRTQIMVSAEQGLLSLRWIELLYSRRTGVIDQFYPRDPVTLPVTGRTGT